MFLSSHIKLRNYCVTDRPISLYFGNPSNGYTWILSSGIFSFQKERRKKLQLPGNNLGEVSGTKKLLNTFLNKLSVAPWEPWIPLSWFHDPDTGQLHQKQPLAVLLGGDTSTAPGTEQARISVKGDSCLLTKLCPASTASGSCWALCTQRFILSSQPEGLRNQA